jgi:hypothetical protein
MNMETARTLGTLVEQGKWLAREIGDIKTDIKDIKKAHLTLLTEHWKLYAKVSGISILVSLFTVVVVEFFTRASIGGFK